jgi:hypothetical protein
MSQDQELSTEEIERIEEERAQRLSDEERPAGAEIDNTGRDFDVAKGLFTDSPGYDQAPERFPAPTTSTTSEEPPEDQVGPDDQPSVAS